MTPSLQFGLGSISNYLPVTVRLDKGKVMALEMLYQLLWVLKVVCQLETSFYLSLIFLRLSYLALLYSLEAKYLHMHLFLRIY